MSVWALLQIVFNLTVFAGITALWFRLRRPPQDDPRLSRGLQLLQTKITVLEDLSDRTDNQVKQLTSLLDQKTRVLQNKVLEAEQQILKIDHSMTKSMEVAEIFQDKIPHQEIVERQQKVEYVRAARMAHSGLSVDEIAAQVALPREQIELIAKFNREQLMFDEDALPEWANRAMDADQNGSFALSDIDFIGNLERPAPDLNQMAQIGNNFKQAVETVKQQDIVANQSLMDSKVAETLRASMATGMQTMQPAVMSMKATAQTLREKLAATAEDLLRSGSGAPITVAQAMAAQVAAAQAAAVQTAPVYSAAQDSYASPAAAIAALAGQAAGSYAYNSYAANEGLREEGSQPLSVQEVRSVMTSQPTVRKVQSFRSDSPVRPDSPAVKKVIFPRIEK